MESVDGAMNRRTAAVPPRGFAARPFARVAMTAEPKQDAGLGERDVAFMQRLRNLASEALTWPHLGARQRLVWAAAAELEAVPLQELPPWFWERQNITHRHPGLDLLSLDGSHAVGCWNSSVSFKEVRRFLRMARWVYKAEKCTVVTSSRELPKKVQDWLHNSGAEHRVIGLAAVKRWGAADPLPAADYDGGEQPLRQCQLDCLEACTKGARVIEMACGSGKTRVIKELVSNTSGRVLITVPLRALLDQFVPDFPGFCKVGTGHNKRIDYDAEGFIAVTDSVHLLKKLRFQSIFVDEGHHPLPPKLPKSLELYRMSATHKEDPDFRYTMGQAIEDGVLCDYDITVPALTAHHAYLCLADLLAKQAGRFRRVLAYCNSVAEAKRFRMVLKELGLAAWHINAKTPLKKRVSVIEEFAGPLQKPVHVLVTVEVLGEGINIPNADTCMFVEPRNSYRSIIQAIGRVLRHHPAKTLAHIVLPAVAIPNSKVSSMLWTEGGGKMSEEEGQQNAGEIPKARSLSRSCTKSKGMIEEQGRQNAGENFGVRQLRRERSLETPEDIYLQSPGAMIQVKEHQLQEQNKMRTSTRTDHSRINPTSDFQLEEVRGSRLNNDVAGKLESFGSSSPVPLTVATGSKNGWAHTDGQHYGDSRTKPEVLVAESQKTSEDESKSGALGVSQGLWRPFAGRGGSDISRRTTANAVMFDIDGEPQSNQPRLLHGKLPKQMGDQRGIRPTEFEEEKLAHCENLEALDPRGWERFQAQQLTPQRRFPAWTSLNQIEEERPWDIVSPNGATLRPKLRGSLKMKVPSGSLAFDQGFGSQLERFLATLMQADYRLVGATAAHRIHIADCTLANCRARAMEELTAEIYGRLSVILCQEDPWEVRLKNVEAFVSKHSRLPSSKAADDSERTLGVWLQNQCVRFCSQRMPLHRFRRLLSSAPLIRRRAQQWQFGGADERFRENCQKLREHVQLHGSLPTQSRSSNPKLARWLNDVRRCFRPLRPDRKKMLQEVHPLVQVQVEKWQNWVPEINRPLWERRLGELSEFVSGTKRIPRQTRKGGGDIELRCYQWLRTQHRDLLAGILPSDLVQRLRDAHPLIAAYLNAQVKHQRPRDLQLELVSKSLRCKRGGESLLASTLIPFVGRTWQWPPQADK